MFDKSDFQKSNFKTDLLTSVSGAARAAPLVLIMALTACQSSSSGSSDVADAANDVTQSSGGSAGSSGSGTSLDTGTTYASADVSSLAEALDDVGDSLTVPSSVIMRSTNLNELADGSVSITITKTTDGYDLTYGDSTVSLTSEDLIDGGYEKYVTAGDDSSGDIAGLLALNGDITTKLASSSVMVPVRYWVELKDGAITTAGDADSSAVGYTAIGVVTDPDDMPTTGTASYSGGGQIQVWATNADTDSTNVKRLRYDGTSAFSVDFDSGSLTGAFSVTDLRTYYDDGSRTDADVTSEGYQYLIEEATISGNEITVVSETGNSALDAQLDSTGLLDADGMDTEASGLFYGEDADALAIAVSGSGSSAVMSGLLYGDKD